MSHKPTGYAVKLNSADAQRTVPQINTYITSITIEGRKSEYIQMRNMNKLGRIGKQTANSQINSTLLPLWQLDMVTPSELTRKHLCNFRGL